MFYVVRLTTNKDSLSFSFPLSHFLHRQTPLRCLLTYSRCVSVLEQEQKKMGKKRKIPQMIPENASKKVFYLFFFVHQFFSCNIDIHTPSRREKYIRATFGIIICNLSYSMGSTNIFRSVKEEGG
jgi:hypothetical protein